MVDFFPIRKLLDSLWLAVHVPPSDFFHLIYLCTHQCDCHGGSRGWIIACLHGSLFWSWSWGLLPDARTPHLEAAGSLGAVLFMPWQRALTKSLGTEPGTGRDRGAKQRATEQSLDNQKSKTETGREENGGPIPPVHCFHMDRICICIKI